MQTFADVAAQHAGAEPDSFLRATDRFGRQNVMPLREAHHHTHAYCICHPKTVCGVIVHRTLFNFGALYKPWQAGH